MEPMIQCPACRKEIKLTESLAAPLVDAMCRDLEAKMAEKDNEISRREAAAREQEQNIVVAKKHLDDEIQAGIRRERDKIAREEQKKARIEVSDELEGKARELTKLEDILRVKDTKLLAAQNAQADLVRKQRELDDARQELELTVEQRVQESLGPIRDKARRGAQEESTLKLAEREETISGLRRQIDVLKQKAEQGSQQLQGEVQELELESLLAAKFPTDRVEPVPKGEFGGDIVQEVRNLTGTPCGSILWESKRTKKWSNGWVAKLRKDQRAARAELAVIVSRALPKDVDSFALVDGVWVVEPHFMIPVAIALRQTLIEVSAVRQSAEGQQTKMEMVYQYLAGPRFRARVEVIVEKFTEMREDLARERSTMVRLWAKREEQIREVVESTAGMYGDLQGIAGKSFNEIASLDIPLLPAGEEG